MSWRKKMSDELLRQPRTFWQWLTNQPGTLFVPPPAPIVQVNPAKSALDYIESELERMHEQMEGLRGNTLSRTEAPAYVELTKTLSKLHDELVRRSKDEEGLSP
jgi:hypothetical protein